MSAAVGLPTSSADDLDALEKRAMEGCPHHSVDGANLQTVCVCFEQSAHEILTLIAAVRALRLHKRLTSEAIAR